MLNLYLLYILTQQNPKNIHYYNYIILFLYLYIFHQNLDHLNIFLHNYLYRYSMYNFLYIYKLLNYLYLYINHVLFVNNLLYIEIMKNSIFVQMDMLYLHIDLTNKIYLYLFVLMGFLYLFLDIFDLFFVGINIFYLLYFFYNLKYIRIQLAYSNLLLSCLFIGILFYIVEILCPKYNLIYIHILHFYFIQIFIWCIELKNIL